MTISIQNGLSGLNTVRNISLIQRSLSRTMQRLASGLQINQAADGPADLVISEQMRSQIGSLSQQIKNLEFNLNKNNAADSAIAELQGKVAEIRTLAVAAADEGSATPETGKVYQQQVDDLVATYNQQVQNAEFGSQKLFDGSSESVSKLKNLEGFNVSTPEDAANAISKISSVLSDLGDKQGSIGAKSKYEYETTIRSLEVTSQNLTAAESSIRDANYAAEQASYLKQVIQLNSGLAALTQGNLATDSVFKLLHA